MANLLAVRTLAPRPLPPGLSGPARLLALLNGLMLAVILACLLAAWPAQAANDNFLPPEQAFKVSARMLAADRAEVVIAITDGYYVYREPLAFTATQARLGPAQIPPGTVKYDENFQKNVETYRGTLRIGLPVQQADGPFSLSVVSQGCADAGLCYPPMTSEFTLNPAVLQPVAGAGPPPSALDEAGMVDAALQGGQLGQVVGVFFGLGLLLSLTPCVLPMLPILSSLIVGAAGPVTRARGLLLAASYALGMAVVYTALGVAAGLAGEGLAAALQTPWAIASFAALLVLLSLSMFDVYQLRLPAALGTGLSSQANRLPAGQVVGALGMGGVSALMVSPCVSAPLAGALLFISQTRDAVLGGTALFAMAMGMSVPLLLLGASAGRWLPKAGPWMQGVKKFFGVLMLGVALWLAQPVLPAGLAMAGWGALAWLAAVLVLRPWRLRAEAAMGVGGVARLVLGVLLGLLGTLQLAGAATGGRDPLQPWSHWAGPRAQPGERPVFQVIRSEAELDAALRQADGRPVVLDFWAEWCVSCQEMERFTFSDPAVAARLAHAVLLKADVTANQASERALLRRFRLFGPPGIVFFDARGQEVAGSRVIGFQDARRFEGSLDRAGL